MIPHLKRWLAAVRCAARGAARPTYPVEAASQADVSDPKVRAVLFGQKAR